MKNILFGILIGLGFTASMAYAAQSVFIVQQGGTGAQTLGASQVVTGNGTSPVYTTATTSVTCTGNASCTAFTVLDPTSHGAFTINASGGSGGSSVFASSTNFTAGQLPYATNTNGTPITLGAISTTTVSCAGTTSCVAFTILDPTGHGAFTITGTGLSSDPNWNFFQATGGNYLAPTTTAGIIVSASSTIGNGAGAGGLTINGNATSTGIFISTSAGTASAPNFNVGNRAGIYNGGASILSFAAGGFGISFDEPNFTFRPNDDNELSLGSTADRWAILNVITASTTNLTVGAVRGSVQCLQANIQGVVSGTPCGIASYDSWTHPSYNGQVTSATSTGIWLTGTPLSLIASSTFETQASSTQLSSGTNTFYVNSSGGITGKDVTAGLSGIISPVHHLSLMTGTSTTWTASTTNSAASPFAVAPFAGTLQDARCVPYINGSAGSFLGVNVLVNGSATTPSYFVASSTVGVITFSSGNTFTAGQTILVNFGTTTTATATSISCTLDITQTS